MGNRINKLFSTGKSLRFHLSPINFSIFKRIRTEINIQTSYLTWLGSRIWTEQCQRHLSKLLFKFCKKLASSDKSSFVTKNGSREDGVAAISMKVNVWSLGVILYFLCQELCNLEKPSKKKLHILWHLANKAFDLPTPPKLRQNNLWQFD